MVFCGLTWWKKLEHQEETTDLRQVTTALSYADAMDQTLGAEVASQGFTPALFYKLHP